MNILDKILSLFGLCRLSQYNVDIKQIMDQNAEIDRVHQRVITTQQENIRTLTDAYDESIKLIDSLQCRINTVEFKTLEEYKINQNRLEAEHAALQEKIEGVLSFQKEVERQVSKLLHDDARFGFSGNFAFPGSTSIASEIIHDEETAKPYIAVYGRTVLTDEHSNKLGQLLTLNEKLQYIMNTLHRQNIYDRITKDLMKLGAIQYTVGYNSDCTAYEIYYAISAYVPDAIYVDMLGDK